MWVTPPQNKVAAPLNPKAAPFEAAGAIINDIATNPDSEGIVLKTADGKRIPLVMLMFLEGPTQERLKRSRKCRTPPSARVDLSRPIRAGINFSSRAAAC